jgi:small basic protein (TIGR04137 family)
MSIHPSLRGVDNLVGQRSVLSRVERIQKLTNDGKFDQENDSVYGLPKVRTKFKQIGGKKKKKAEAEEGEAAEGAEGEAAAEGDKSS